MTRVEGPDMNDYAKIAVLEEAQVVLVLVISGCTASVVTPRRNAGG